MKIWTLTQTDTDTGFPTVSCHASYDAALAVAFADAQANGTSITEHGPQLGEGEEFEPKITELDNDEHFLIQLHEV